jgi:drug/metabolite transporter (DMT)-like permease
VIPKGTSDAPLRAVLLMVAGCALLTVNDAIMKHVTGELPLGESIFIRGLFTFIPVCFLTMRAGGWRVLRITQWRGQLLRGALLGISTLCFLESLAHLPLAQATAMVFASPIILTVLAPALLGEKVSRNEWFAVVAGFIGVLLMLSPDAQGFRWVVLLPLGAALGEALRDVITRKLVATESSESMLFVSVIAVNVVALSTVGFGWRAPTDEQWLALLLAGGLLGVAHFFMTDAFRYAKAIVVAPFRYAGVIWALVAGFVAFGELPSGMTLIGAAVVVLSGLYVLRQSLRRTRASR